MGLYVQDQWTRKRLTVNLGLRFEYLNAYDLATTQPAGRFLPERSFPEADHAAELTPTQWPMPGSLSRHLHPVF